MQHATTRKKLITTAALLGAACLLPGLAMAQVTGACVDCHTMHNSQGGASMNFNASATPNGMLLRGDCVGCHTNTTNGNGRGGTSNNIPYVNHTTTVPGAASGGMLAGGSFYWGPQTAAVGAHAKVHNVSGISVQDTTLLNVPPGQAAALTGQLTCGGSTGCHGDRALTTGNAALVGSHHAPSTAGGYMDGSSLANSYRFLNGVKGIESADWESLQTMATRNVYAGVARTDQTVNNAATISSLCGQCHGDFHRGASKISGVSATGMTTPWVRHPTDFDMFAGTGAGSEYRSYTYNMEAPVAMPAGTMSAGYTRPTGALVATEAIVTCISCHRAHGSANADLLRWDYSTMLAHNAAAPVQNTGCFQCHRNKDT